MSEDEQLKRQVISKHIEGWNDDKMKNSSIEHFAKHGKASGGFFLAIKEMLEDYFQVRSKNLGK